MAKVQHLTWDEMKLRIRAGDKVVGRFPAGLGIRAGRTFQEYSKRCGRVVIAPSGYGSEAIEHFVLNMGGRYETPGVVGEDNFVEAWKDGTCYRLVK